MISITRKLAIVASITGLLTACDFSDNTTELGSSEVANTEPDSELDDNFGLQTMQLDGISMLEDAAVRNIYYLDADSEPVDIEYLTLVTPDENTQ